MHDRVRSLQNNFKTKERLIEKKSIEETVHGGVLTEGC